MKKLLLLSAMFLAGFSSKAFAAENDSLGLPGDNLDLYGVLDLFKQSSSLEEFEKKLNDPANEINNLDLNGDNDVDYIRVVDQVDGDAHAIVLEVPVSDKEAQDVAVIELEKTGTESADVQIVGDEELYGENYVVEAQSETPATDAKWQGFRPVVVVNVWMWPCVRFVYAPAYVLWVSPWHWAHYPGYWRPWHPVMWRVYHPRVVHYHVHYVCVHERRMAHAHMCYSNHRVASNAVHQRYATDHQRRAAAQGQRNAGGNKGGKQNAQHPRAGGQKQGGGQKQQHAAPRAGGGNHGGGNRGGGGNHGGGGHGGRH
jgi:uncharacterized membrane protein YgcG